MKKPIYVLLAIGLIFSCNQTKKTDTETSTEQTIETKTETKKERRGGPGGPGGAAKQEAALKEAFKGVVTSNGKQESLFSIEPTGVSTAPIVTAAKAFVSGLTKEQAAKTLYDIDATEWRHWSNVDNGIFARNGISIKEMNQDQRKLAFNLLSVALSAKGLQLTKDVMKTDQTLKELNNGDERFSEDLYFFTVMGTPSNTEPWGWQLEGHHLVINYFVLGDQMVMTPTFMGGEPVFTTSGKYKGNTIFQDEQNIGLKFMQSLSEAQQQEATLSTEKSGANIEAGAFSDNVTVDFEGVKASSMTPEQKEALLHLTAQYINNMREGHAKVKMEDIKKHIEDTYFAWRGTTADDAVFYYRIHSPVILIEFDHQSPVGVRGADRSPTRNHIHAMIRTPNGNDYGKDYLKQHLENHHH